jgi:hypothetical protein
MGRSPCQERQPKMVETRQKVVNFKLCQTRLILFTLILLVCNKKLPANGVMSSPFLHKIIFFSIFFWWPNFILLVTCRGVSSPPVGGLQIHLDGVVVCPSPSFVCSRYLYRLSTQIKCKVVSIIFQFQFRFSMLCTVSPVWFFMFWLPYASWSLFGSVFVPCLVSFPSIRSPSRPYIFFSFCLKTSPFCEVLMSSGRLFHFSTVSICCYKIQIKKILDVDMTIFGFCKHLGPFVTHSRCRYRYRNLNTFLFGDKFETRTVRYRYVGTGTYSTVQCPLPILCTCTLS